MNNRAFMESTKSRSLIPCLLLLAILVLLVFKLPWVTSLYSRFDCSLCTIGAPLITWLGAGYFAALLTFFLLCPDFPSRRVAGIGVVWACGVGFLLLFSGSSFCFICLFAHLFHVLFWGYFLFYPGRGVACSLPLLKKGLFATQIGMLGFLSYYVTDGTLFYLIQEKWDRAPEFAFATVRGKQFGSEDLSKVDFVVLHFILPECKYCKKQLSVLEAMAVKYASGKIEFFNLIVKRHGELESDLDAAIKSLSPHIQNVIDHRGRLSKEFNVHTFPTIYVIDSKGRIVKNVVGTFSSLQFELDTLFSSSQKEHSRAL